MITSGGIDAITLIAKSMLDPGDVVLVEQPSYLGAVAGFASFDAEVIGVPMDEHGLDVEALARLLASGVRAKAALHDPRPPEPDRLEPRRATAARAGRDLPTPRRPHRRGRRLPRARFRRFAGAEPLVAGAGRGRADRHLLEDVLPRRTARLGRRPGRGRRADWCSPSRTPTSAPARSGSECSRIRPRRPPTRTSCRAPARSTGGAPPSMTEALATSPPAPAPRGPCREGGFFCWLRLPGVDTVALAAARPGDASRLRARRRVLRRGRRHRAPPALLQPGRRCRHRRGHRASGRRRPAPSR